MSWFKRKKAGILTDKRDQNDTPAGQWVKCPACGEILNRRDYQEHLRVCSKCRHHFRMDSLGYFESLFDDGRYDLHDTDLTSGDPLSFTDRKPYAQRLDAAIGKTKLNDAARAATGTIGGHRVSIASMDFSFIGGSMGSVVGEIIARAMKRGFEHKTPMMIISQRGGARVVEGAPGAVAVGKKRAPRALLRGAGLPCSFP